MTANLLDACRSGNVKRLEELLIAGHSPDEPLDTIGTTPLMVAGTLGVLEVLLNTGASIAPTRFGHDVLQVVVSDDESAFEDASERLAAARILIEHGAPLDRRNKHGWSRLYVATFAGNAGAVETLVALGGDPNDWPPPLAAASWGTGDDPAATTRIIDLLAVAGADVHRCDDVGWSVLHAAAMPYSHGDGFTSSDGPNVAAIQALISHGVGPDVAGPGGTTPLMLVAGDGRWTRSKRCSPRGPIRAFGTIRVTARTITPGEANVASPSYSRPPRPKRPTPSVSSAIASADVQNGLLHSNSDSWQFALTRPQMSRQGRR